MRILFAGNPEMAVPVLKAFAQSFTVVGVLTSCDKPQGRSSALVPPPVKVAAMELGIPVLQFDSLKTQARLAVSELGANVLVSFSFSRIFGPRFLALFEKGCFNIHPSLLPQFRGPSPLQSTILSGLKESGISIQEIGLAMDEGAVYSVLPFSLDGKETNESLTEKISQAAPQFAVDTLKKVFEGKLVSKAQSGEVSYCNLISKEDARLSFKATAKELHCKIRAMYPWPKAFATGSGKTVIIGAVWGGYIDLEAEPLAKDVVPGKVVGIRKDRGIGIACSDKVLWVTSLQLPTKKELDFRAFANGNPWILDALFD